MIESDNKYIKKAPKPIKEYFKNIFYDSNITNYNTNSNDIPLQIKCFLEFNYEKSIEEEDRLFSLMNVLKDHEPNIMAGIQFYPFSFYIFY